MENQNPIEQQRQLIHFLCESFERKVMDYEIGLIHRTTAANQMDQTYLKAMDVLKCIPIDYKGGLLDDINISYDNATRKLHNATVKGNEFTENFWKRIHC